jgi:hypothetical protein
MDAYEFLLARIAEDEQIARDAGHEVDAMNVLSLPSPTPHDYESPRGEREPTGPCAVCGLNRQAPVHIQDSRLTRKGA